MIDDENEKSRNENQVVVYNARDAKKSLNTAYQNNQSLRKRVVALDTVDRDTNNLNDENREKKLAMIRVRKENVNKAKRKI